MRLFPSYPAHVVHYGPARAKAELWRLILGLVIATGIFVLLAILYREMIVVLSAPMPTLLQDFEDGTTRLAMYLILFSFALISVATFVVVKFLHNRPIRSVFGPIGLAVPQFGVVAIMVVLLGIVIAVLPPWGLDAPYVPNLPLGNWLLLLPLSLLAVFVQSSSEEIFFRGYVQQQLAARFRSPLVWMVLPSVIFAAGHYTPATAGDNALMIAVWAGIFGMLMADLTARAGSLGPAMAVHFVNNVAAILVTSLPGDLSGLALYHTPFGLEDEAMMRAWLPVDFAAMLVTWLAARLALRR